MAPAHPVTVAIVASAWPADSRAKVRAGIAVLERFGFAVVEASDAGLGARERADDLHRAFANDAVDAVLELRGGYGSAG